MVVMLNTCCFKYDLKKGCIVLGILCLVFSLLTILAAPLTMSKMERELEHWYQDHNGRWSRQERRKLYDATLIVLRATFYGMAAMALLDAVCSTILIFGARQEKPSLVLPWVIEQMVILPVCVLLALAFVVISFMGGDVSKALFSIFTLAVRGGATVYFILVVYSLYRYLRGEPVPTDHSRAV